MISKEQSKSGSIGKRIGILSRASQVYFQHQFRDYPLGHAQVVTLHFICRHNGLIQNELVQYLNLDKSSVSSQLNKLEENGYIKRIANEADSRSRKIFITKKTKEFEDDLHQKFSAWSKILLKGFSVEETENVYHLLDKLISNAHNAIEDCKIDEKEK
jgi:DNA-binding MarR family transcriptional regulator